MGRFRYSYNQLVYFGEAIERSAERLARFGYDAIELVGEPDGVDVEHVRKAVADAGLTVSSICSIYTAERDLSCPDPAVRAAGLEYVRRVADFAAGVGAPVMIIAPGAVGRVGELGLSADGRKWAIEALRVGGEYAAELDVDLTLECWNRYETCLLNRLEQAAELWDEAGLARGGVMGDTFHMAIEERDLAQAIRDTGELLNHVHLADSNRAAPGAGHTDFAPILRALADIGYDGFLSFELLPASADPFGVMRAGGHADFFDRYTEQAIVHLKQVESELGLS